MKTPLTFAMWLVLVVVAVCVVVVLAAFVSVVADRIRRRRVAAELEALVAGVPPRAPKRKTCPLCSGRGDVHRLVWLALVAYFVLALANIVVSGTANVVEWLR